MLRLVRGVVPLLLASVTSIACASRPRSPVNASVAELCCRAGVDARQQLSSVEMRPRADGGVLLGLGWRRTPAELERALSRASLAPADAASMATLASLHIERGYWSADVQAAAQDFATAEGNLESALTIDDRCAAARTQLALLYLARAKQVNRAAEVARAGVATAANAVPGSSAGQLERALGLALQAVREHPTYAPARNALGLVSYELGDAAEAVRQFSLATALQPADADAFSNLGAALSWARDFVGAQRAYARALALRDDGDRQEVLSARAKLGEQPKLDRRSR